MRAELSGALFEPSHLGMLCVLLVKSVLYHNDFKYSLIQKYGVAVTPPPRSRALELGRVYFRQVQAITLCTAPRHAFPRRGVRVCERESLRRGIF